MPNLYVELRQSVLGVRVPEDIQMEGFRVKIEPNLDMGVPGVVQSAGGCRGSTVHPSAPDFDSRSLHLDAFWHSDPKHRLTQLNIWVGHDFA